MYNYSLLSARITSFYIVKVTRSIHVCGYLRRPGKLTQFIRRLFNINITYYYYNSIWISFESCNFICAVTKFISRDTVFSSHVFIFAHNYLYIHTFIMIYILYVIKTNNPTTIYTYNIYTHLLYKHFSLTGYYMYIIICIIFYYTHEDLVGTGGTAAEIARNHFVRVCIRQ